MALGSVSCSLKPRILLRIQKQTTQPNKTGEKKEREREKEKREEWKKEKHKAFLIMLMVWVDNKSAQHQQFVLPVNAKLVTTRVKINGFVACFTCSRTRRCVTGPVGSVLPWRALHDWWDPSANLARGRDRAKSPDPSCLQSRPLSRQFSDPICSFVWLV